MHLLAQTADFRTGLAGGEEPHRDFGSPGAHVPHRATARARLDAEDERDLGFALSQVFEQ
jgi:hypothetical protein